MSASIPNPQPPEIVAALRAAGCGIIRKPITAEPVGKPPRAPRTRHLKTVRSVVAAFCRVSVHEMLSERRFTEVVRARHIFYFAARELTSASLPAIGRACNGKDHSTVLHGIRKVETNREMFEPELTEVLDYMKAGK